MSPVGGPAVGKPTSNRARAPLKWATLGLLSHWGLSRHGAPAAPSPADAVYHVTAICVYGSTCVNIGVALTPGVRSRSFYVLRARCGSHLARAGLHPTLWKPKTRTLSLESQTPIYFGCHPCAKRACVRCVCAQIVSVGDGSGGSARSARLK